MGASSVSGLGGGSPLCHSPYIIIITPTQGLNDSLFEHCEDCSMSSSHEFQLIPSSLSPRFQRYELCHTKFLPDYEMHASFIFYPDFFEVTEARYAVSCD